MNRDQVEAVYPLSPLQEGLLFHTLYDPASPVYFDQLILSLEGDLDQAAFARSWQTIVRRHGVLRTAFAWKTGTRPLQIVVRDLEAPFRLEDWRAVAPAEHAARLETFLAEDRARGFEPSRPPLHRFALIRLDERQHTFVWSRHHLLVDGWSLSLLLEDALAAYLALRDGATHPAKPRRPYGDYIEWLQRQDRGAAERFWRHHLAGFDTPTPLGLARQDESESPTRVSARYDEHVARLSTTESERVRSWARESQVTLNTVIQGAWAILLARLSSETDVVFGATSAGRPADLADAESMVGLFINTLPVRVRVPGGVRVKAWLRNVQSLALDARQHEYASLVDVQGWSGVARGRSLFDSIVVFENYPVDASLERPIEGLRVGSVRTFERTNYPLTLIVSPAGDIGLTWIYDANRFDETAIRRWAGYFRTILQQLTKEPEPALGQVSCLEPVERDLIVRQWNATSLPFDDRCLHVLVDLQAKRTPDEDAVVYGAGRLTYRELIARADAVAERLRALGVGPEVTVGVCARRTPDLIAVLLGVLKAGGAYVPLDPAYPEERLAHMLTDSRATVVVTEACLRARCPAGSWHVLCVDEVLPLIDGSGRLQPADRPPKGGRYDRHEQDSRDDTGETASHRGAHPDSLAYVIYTSGSTGQPKGTAITHRSVAALIAWAETVYSRDELSGVLASTSVCFDLSVFEIFVPLATGGTVILAEHVLELPALAAAQRVRLINTVPSAIAELVRQDGSWIPAFAGMTGAHPPPAARLTVNLAGEPLTGALADRLYALPAVARVYDLYGPSEDTTYSTVVLRAPGGPATIGRPIANTELYLLDAHLEPVPAGIVGEIYLGGDGLARGYFDRPALTADRFVPDPFSGRPGARLYRTGDLGRLTPDGCIEFLGRRDHQVKVRGFRIELGEIQSCLETREDLADVAVVARRDDQGELRVIAYYVPREESPAHAVSMPGSVALREYASRRLPSYLVPDVFCALPQMPRTPNGKLDRRALPDVFAAAGAASGPVPRASADQELLLQIWRDVLDRQDVGPHDNFFELGGHSLIATRVISRVREAFGTPCPLRTLFDHPTVAGLAEALAQVRRRVAAPDAGPIPRLARAGAPLSFAQQRLWFLHQLDPDGSAYKIPAGLEIAGGLDSAAFEASFGLVIRRHDILRSRVELVGGQPWVVTAIATEDVPLQRVDLSKVPDDERQARADAVIQADVSRPFDLLNGPLLRATLVTLSPTKHLFIVTVHHIAADGWSLDILVRELAAAYREIVAGRRPELPDLPIQFADFAAWQREWLASPVFETERRYWLERLAGVPPCEVPPDFARPPDWTGRGSAVTLELPPPLVAAVRDLGRREGMTPYMTMCAAFVALLHRQTGSNQVVVGTPVAGRTRREVEALVGCFVNAVAIRADVGRQMSFRSLLRQVRSAALDAYAHQDMPFERLVDELHLDRDLSRHPVFQVLFAYERDPLVGVSLPGLSVRALEIPRRAARLDLSLTILEREERIDLARSGRLQPAERPPTGGRYDSPSVQATMEFSTDLFEPRTIERMLDGFVRLLEAAVADPSRPIDALPVLSAADHRSVVHEWNGTAATFQPVRCLHHLVEAQVERTPDRAAVVDGPRTVAYRDLERMANTLAHELQRLSVQVDEPVAVCLDRSIEMVVAILGVLKAGGAYVPVAPDTPTARIGLLVRESSARVILTTSGVAEGLPAAGVAVLKVDELISRTRDLADPGRPKPGAHPDSLAYILYTSGSTGVPKGAAISHGSIINHMQWMASAYQFGAEDAVLLKTPFTFDASVWEFFAPLMAGARLVVAESEGHRDPAYLCETIQQHGVTILQVVPSLLSLLVEEPMFVRCTTVRRVFSGGEPLSAALRDRFFARSRAELINLYGPTEATIDALAWMCRPDEGAIVPIGRPVANMRAYVLDGRLEPVPVGAVGELFLGGRGVARGYWRAPDLTAAAFVPDPFGSEPGGRLYRTGDLVRYRHQFITGSGRLQPADRPPKGGHYDGCEMTSPGPGVLQFVGRADQQVKIRGHRIEPGEIEATLRQYPAVRQAAVIVRADQPDRPRLVAYVVGDRSAGSDELRSFLATRLPAHLVPDTFVALDTLPVLPSGKLDRRALPAPSAPPREGSPPRTREERQLVNIWQDVLGRSPIGIHDNFFALGGDSIQSIQVVSRARTAGLRITPRQVFQHQTIATLAAAATAVTTGTAASAPLVGPCVLTPIQRWWAELSPSGPHHWNQAILLETPPGFDVDRATRAFGRLIEHHDALRLRFTRNGDDLEARFAPVEEGTVVKRVAFHPEESDSEWLARLGAACEAAQRGMDLAHGPIVRAVWFDRGSEQPGRLLLAIHHLAVDAVSWRILLDDLALLYERGETHRLPSKTSSISAWGALLSRLASEGIFDEELSFWRSMGGAIREGVERELGDSSVDLVGSEALLEIALGRAETRALVDEVAQPYRMSIDEVLLAALGRAVMAWTGDRVMWLDLEAHGRDPADRGEELDTTRTVGWLTALFPFRLAAPATDDPEAWLVAAKEQRRSVPRSGLGYGVLRYLHPDATVRDVLARLPRRDLVFNYLGQFDAQGVGATTFRGASESPGQTRSPRGRRPHALAIDASVSGGQLRMTWTYSTALHRRVTIERVTERFVEALGSFIDFCRSTGSGRWTASDFADTGLSREDLSKLLTRLE